MKECNSCGKCCIKYGEQGISASEADIEGWALFNPEIDDYVRGEEIWMDPATGKPLDYCPWLRKHSDAKSGRVYYHCDIYLDRPEDCRHYPSSIAEMQADGCEMIEVKDLTHPKRAQKALDKLMADSRPAYGRD